MARLIHFDRLQSNGHLRRPEKLFGPIDRELENLPAQTSFVFLCFTNRCGSNFLAELLASSGKYNLTEELLNRPVVRTVEQRH
jgi:hypothetical protein